MLEVEQLSIGQFPNMCCICFVIVTLQMLTGTVPILTSVISIFSTSTYQMLASNFHADIANNVDNYQYWHIGKKPNQHSPNVATYSGDIDLSCVCDSC